MKKKLVLFRVVLSFICACILFYITLSEPNWCNLLLTVLFSGLFIEAGDKLTKLIV